MNPVQNTLRHETFAADADMGPWESLERLKGVVEDYVNEFKLTPNVVNISESIYVWARGEEFLSRAFGTRWFWYPRDEASPTRHDSLKPQ